MPSKRHNSETSEQLAWRSWITAMSTSCAGPANMQPDRPRRASQWKIFGVRDECWQVQPFQRASAQAKRSQWCDENETNRPHQHGLAECIQRRASTTHLKGPSQGCIGYDYLAEVMQSNTGAHQDASENKQWNSRSYVDADRLHETCQDAA